MILLNRSLFHAVLLAGCSVFASTAHAQTLSAEDVAALKAEIAALRAQVQSLEARVGKAEGDASAATAAASAASTTAQAVQVAQKDAPTIKFKGAPEISDGKGWSFKPRGRLLFDAGYIAAPGAVMDQSDGLGFSSEIRRARLGVEGTIPGGFGYRFDVEFAGVSSGRSAEIFDAYLTYAHKGLTVTAGQQNPFQGLEELSSSSDTSFIERAAFTDAFNFRRRIGVSAQYKTGDWLMQGGLFTDNAVELEADENKSYSGDARLVYAPKLGDTQLHFGASGHWRHLGAFYDSVRYRQRPEAHTTDVRFIDTGEIATATSEAGYGLEAAIIAGRFHAMGETYWQKVGRRDFADPTFFGGAIEAGYFLTKDKREYKDGVFKGVKVSNPVNEGGIGAWQVNMRYDRLDLNDAGIVGGKQNSYTASLIWTPVDNIRFLVDYAHLVYTDVVPALANGTDRSYGVDSIGARAQIGF